MTGEFIFCVGAPGCGKSTFYHTTFNDTHTLLDVDVEKRKHEKHDELKETEEGRNVLHEWGRKQLRAAFDAAMSHTTETMGKNFYLSTGGGTTAQEKIQRAKTAGFFVRVIELKATGSVDATENNEQRVRVMDDESLDKYKLALPELIKWVKEKKKGVDGALVNVNSYQVVYNDSCNWLLQGIDMDSACSDIAKQATSGADRTGFKFERMVSVKLDVKALSDINDGAAVVGGTFRKFGAQGMHT
jgi:shikimate kinase